MEWSCGDDGVVGEDGVDDDPDEARDDDDGDDLPSPGRNFSGRFLPAGELSLSVASAPEVAAEYFFEASPMIFRSDRSYTRKGGTGGDPGPPGGPQERPRGGSWPGASWCPGGSPLFPLLASLVIWQNIDP